ncbi:MAG TPA: hypothetical protein VLA33_10505 [Gemmatimonadota bacterium]|nr:hypothetical protein [Gemmatimonadota bacterium]
MTGIFKGGSLCRWIAKSACIAFAGAAALTGAAIPAVAQDTAPRLPFGSAAVVLPVQSTLPLPGGAWPGDAGSQQEALEAMDAELAFALAERRAAREWALPPDLRRRVERNPMIRVDPDRVAYQGLVARPDRREQIYEPLHGQLRALAALFGTRFVILPLRLRMAPERDAPQGSEAGSEGAGATSCAGGQPPRRPELLLALIDIRRSAVLWHGTVQGRPGCPEDGGLLADLAASVARQLTES